MFLSNFTEVLAQCSTAPAIPSQPSCPSSGTSLSSSSGVTLTSSTTYKLASTTVTISGALNAASNSIIYVCSGETLNLGNSLFNSGLTIYVLSGGALNFTASSAASNQDAQIYVYGTMNANSFTLNTTTAIQVASTGNINISGTLTLQGSSPPPGTIFAVEGTAKIGTYGFKSGFNSSCMNKNGCIEMSNAPTNNLTFGNTSGPGLIYYTGSCPTLNFTLPASTKVCFAGAGPCTAGRFGLATVTYSCSPTPASCAGVIILPIHLLFFKAKLTNEGVLNTWGINKAWDSDYFVVEKSKNGVDWALVGTVPTGANTEKYAEFSLIDKSPYMGISYYRLSEIDTKGKKTIYAHAFVEIDDYFEGFSLYPNPSNGEVNLHIYGERGEYDLELLDITGKNIAHLKLRSGINQIQSIFTSPGVYFAKLKVGKNSFTKKLVIQ